MADTAVKKPLLDALLASIETISSYQAAIFAATLIKGSEIPADMIPRFMEAWKKMIKDRAFFTRGNTEFEGVIANLQARLKKTGRLKLSSSSLRA